MRGGWRPLSLTHAPCDEMGDGKRERGVCTPLRHPGYNWRSMGRLALRKRMTRLRQD